MQQLLEGKILELKRLFALKKSFFVFYFFLNQGSQLAVIKVRFHRQTTQNPSDLTFSLALNCPSDLTKSRET